MRRSEAAPSRYARRSRTRRLLGWRAFNDDDHGFLDSSAVFAYFIRAGPPLRRPPASARRAAFRIHFKCTHSGISIGDSRAIQTLKLNIDISWRFFYFPGGGTGELIGQVATGTHESRGPEEPPPTSHPRKAPSSLRPIVTVGTWRRTGQKNQSCPRLTSFSIRFPA